MTPFRSPSRREMLAAAAGAAGVAAGASVVYRGKLHLPRKFPVSNVSIVKASGYGGDIYDTMYRLIADQKLSVRGKKIVLKPNLVEYDDRTAINTHPVVVHAAWEAFYKLGAAEVRIAEGPGHRRGTLDLADAAGYFGTIAKFEDAFVDLNTDAVSKRKIPNPLSKMESIYLPQTVLDCDLLVSMPKMKTHHWAGATLSMKNLYGLVPGAVYGWPKNVLHWAGLSETIVDLHHMFPKQFAIVDGVVGMEGNGPIQGTPKVAGVLVAGRDVAGVDATCCRVMGIDPQKVQYLVMARDAENLKESSFRQVGETIASVRTDFELVAEWKGIRLA